MFQRICNCHEKTGTFYTWIGVVHGCIYTYVVVCVYCVMFASVFAPFPHPQTVVFLSYIHSVSVLCIQIQHVQVCTVCVQGSNVLCVYTCTCIAIYSWIWRWKVTIFEDSSRSWKTMSPSSFQLLSSPTSPRECWWRPLR